MEILSDIARGKMSDYMDEESNIDPVKVANAGYSLEAYSCLESDRGSIVLR